jgi:Flp pilus assembly protein TadB
MMEQTANASSIRKAIDKRSSKKASQLSSMMHDIFITPDLFTTVTYINIVFLYIGILLLVANVKINFMYALIYPPIVYFLSLWRDHLKEKSRLQIAHRIPFFSDALANALSVGSTLEQALTQSAYYLKGAIKEEFHKLILKFSLGQDLGVLLRDLDKKFPKTGLRYLISLLEEYTELGVGISPMLKRISLALQSKEEAEEKIRAILATGSSYARLSIGMFAVLFFAISYLLKDQLAILLSPGLKPMFLFLIVWAAIGIAVVSRMTAMDFAKNLALKPQIENYLKENKLTIEEKMHYSGINWTPLSAKLFEYFPLVAGFIFAYFMSWYVSNPLMIGLGFAISTILLRFTSEYFLNGLVEDQLIKLIETFPEILQVFIIGLNSGLNTYKAFQFSENSVRGSAPKLLSQELCRTRFAMECGEKHAVTWQRLAKMLPFETVVDFCEIMVVAPMHGESIVRSITHMANSYQAKKLLLIEKKAAAIGQVVIPVIVIAFFPLFLFAVFAPLITKISATFNQ